MQHGDGENSPPGDMVNGLLTRLVSLGVFALALGHGDCVAAAEAPAKGELQDMGERFGKFMGSFVQEMGQTAANRDKGGGTSAGGEGLEWNRRGSGRGEWGSNFRGEERNAPWDRGRGRSYRGAVPMYDPWGANQWGYWNSPLMEYDPWMSSSARADRDWEAWRGYYGAGAVAPWEHEAPWPPGGDRFGPYDGHGPGSYGGWYGNGLGNGGYGPSYGLGERSWGEGGYYPGTRTW